MNARKFDVLIVGGGVIGKAMALALAHLTSTGAERLSIGVVDKNEHSHQLKSTIRPDWDVRVFALNQVAKDILGAIKVWDAMDHSRIEPVLEMKVMDAIGSNSNSSEKTHHSRLKTSAVKGQLQFDAYSAHAQNLAYIVEEQNLNIALNRALQFAQGIEWIATEPQTLISDENKAYVHLCNGEILETDLLIGADGAHSWVRSQSQIDLSYRSYYQQGVVSNFACEKPHYGIAHQWFVQNQGIIALLPLPNQQVSLVWSAPDELAAQLMQEPLTQLSARLHTYCESMLGRLSPLQPENRQAFPLRLIRPHQLIAQRVALIGDAAHAVHPLAGHGMNLGFGDIRDLLKVWDERLFNPKIQRRHLSEIGSENVLKHYQRLRAEEVMLMQYTTDGLHRLFSQQALPIQWLRSTGMHILNQSSFLKRQLISHAMGLRK